MEQLERQLRDALAEEAAAISVSSDVVVVDRFDQDRPERLSARRTRPAWAAIAAAIAVLLFVGVVPLLLSRTRGGEPVTESVPDPTVPAVIAPPVTTTQAPPATTSPLVTTTVPVVAPPLETSWERVVDKALREGEIWAVASSDDLIVAVGDDAPVTGVPDVVGRYQGEDPNGVVWVSTDGRSWDRIDDEAVFGGDGAQILWDVVTGPLGIIASGQDGANAALWFSPDGYQWEKVLVDDLGTPGEVDGLAVMSGDPGWVAIDDDAAPGDAVFVSENGFQWSRIEDPAAVEDHVARSKLSRASQPLTEPPLLGVYWNYAWEGETVIAVGRDTIAAIWISADSGANWQPVDPEQPAFDGYPWPQTLDVTLYGSEIIVGGNAGGDAAVWIGTWDED